MADHPTASTVSTRTLSLGAQRIAVRESAGQGPAILLVHGNSSSSRVWQQTLEGELGRKYRIVAVDLPGHGQSSDAGEAERAATYSIPGYADAIRQVVEQLSLHKAVVVGWSLGGHAALEASAHLPQAAGFMIFGTPPLPFPLPAELDGAFLKLGLGFEKDWNEEQAREYVADFLVPGTHGPAFLMEDAVRTDGHARASLGASIGGVGYRDEPGIVAALTRPLAILHGAQEQIVGLPYLQAMAPSMPTLWRGEVQVVDNAGHALQWEQRAAFELLLDAFVQDCQR
ncbi:MULTISPECIES: alpha/beta fold hydrolase [unclassified Variovorax]|uniref:alpha/beta fold hydrolase n=1 Tax=unclassified Variovorax TaxID=663243 RepID=UPI0008CE9743|nr:MULTISPECIES: alpha/beta hydrolase [unclassified Variovorax]SEK13904.1 Pimeloyl-ACP methyl ester carboxylesterase [Variovorax sp. OK202]SFD92735.1 Pimeloyl-ACP methyl ester carboxylesterase [Variovorax sp. OK212]